jgi:hypothetical protein
VNTTRTIIFALLVSTAGVSHARITRGGSAWLAVGSAHLETGGISDYLTAQGYPEIPRSAFSIGGGGHGIVGRRILLGGEFVGVVAEDSRNEIGRTSGIAGYGFPHLGYIAWANDRLLVYPQIGLGIAGAQVDISDNTGAKTRLMMASVVLDLGLGTEFVIPFNRGHGRGIGGAVIGVRAGYAVALRRSTWQLDDDLRSLPLSGVPPGAGMAGPYIRVIIGGGWFRIDD